MGRPCQNSRRPVTKRVDNLSSYPLPLLALRHTSSRTAWVRVVFSWVQGRGPFSRRSSFLLLLLLPFLLALKFLPSFDHQDWFSTPIPGTYSYIIIITIIIITSINTIIVVIIIVIITIYYYYHHHHHLIIIIIITITTIIFVVVSIVIMVLSSSSSSSIPHIIIIRFSVIIVIITIFTRLWWLMIIMIVWLPRPSSMFALRQRQRKRLGYQPETRSHSTTSVRRESCHGDCIMPVICACSETGFRVQ